MKKFLAFIGGIAIALLVCVAIAYGVNEGFRNDVNNNVFHIEWSQTDETPDDTTGDETQDDTTTEDNTTEDETTGDNSSDVPWTDDNIELGPIPMEE